MFQEDERIFSMYPKSTVVLTHESDGLFLQTVIFSGQLVISQTYPCVCVCVCACMHVCGACVCVNVLQRF